MDVGYGGSEACLFAFVALVFLDGAWKLFVGTGRDTGDDGGGENVLDVAVLVSDRVVAMAVSVVFVGGGRFDVGVGVGVAVVVATVGVAVIVEKEKAKDVGG